MIIGLVRPAPSTPRAAALATIMLTVLTSCAVGPEFQLPVPPALKGFLPGQRESVPGTAVARGADISARWWEVFHSRSLNRLIQDGIDNNQDLRAAEAAVRVAKLRKQLSQAEGLADQLRTEAG